MDERRYDDLREPSIDLCLLLLRDLAELGDGVTGRDRFVPNSTMNGAGWEISSPLNHLSERNHCSFSSYLFCSQVPELSAFLRL